MLYGFSRCSPLVKTLFLRCVSNEILTAQKCFFLLLPARKDKALCAKLSELSSLLLQSHVHKWDLRCTCYATWKIWSFFGKIKLDTVKWSVCKCCCRFTILFKLPAMFEIFSTSQSIHLLFLQALRDLFDSMDKTSSSIPPIILLQFLHMAFPQFAEKGDQGQYLQQVKTNY